MQLELEMESPFDILLLLLLGTDLLLFAFPIGKTKIRFFRSDFFTERIPMEEFGLLGWLRNGISGVGSGLYHSPADSENRWSLESRWMNNGQWSYLTEWIQELGIENLG